MTMAIKIVFFIVVRFFGYNNNNNRANELFFLIFAKNYLLFVFFGNMREKKHAGIAEVTKILEKTVEKELNIQNHVYLIEDYTMNTDEDSPQKIVMTTGVRITEGKGSIIINNDRFKFEAPCLIVLLPGQTVSFSGVQGGKIRIQAIIISDHFIYNIYSESLSFNEINTAFMLNPVTALDQRGNNDIELFARVCHAIATCPGLDTKLHSLKHLILSLFYGSLRKIYAGKEDKDNLRKYVITNKYKELILNNFTKEHGIPFYASRLAVTERYLSMCVKSVTGQTAGYWISYYLMSEAKKMLATSDMNMQQLSDHLGFASLSTFDKFFKRFTAVTPVQYRKTTV